MIKHLDAVSIRVIVTLGITQVIGWGTTYDLPAVFVRQFSSEFSVSIGWVMTGVTVMLGLSAILSPGIGGLINRHGARRFLTIGSAMMAAGLFCISIAESFRVYIAGWIVLGLGAPLALSLAALSAVSQIAGDRARGAISVLLLLTGLSASIFWPLAVWLETVYGWRLTVQSFALLNLLVCLPFHISLPAPAPATISVVDKASRPPLFGTARVTLIVYAGLSFSLSSFVSWGLPLQLVELFKELGFTASLALWSMTVLGVVQILSRALQIVFAGRISILTLALFSLGSMVVALVFLLMITPGVYTAIMFIVLYGLGSGMMTVVRSVGPLELFGRAAYIHALGWLSLPQNLAYAVAPATFGLLIDNYGGKTAIVAAILVLAISSFGILKLAHLGSRESGMSLMTDKTGEKTDD